MGIIQSSRVRYLHETEISDDSVHVEVPMPSDTLFLHILFSSGKDQVVSFTLTNYLNEFYETTDSLSEMIKKFCTDSMVDGIRWSVFKSELKESVINKRFVCPDKKTIIFNVSFEEEMHCFYVKLKPKKLTSPEQIYPVVYALSKMIRLENKDTGNTPSRNTDESNLLNKLAQQMNIVEGQLSQLSSRSSSGKKRQDPDDSDSDEQSGYDSDLEETAVSFPGLRVVSNLKHLRKVLQKKKILHRYYPMLDEAILALSKHTLDSPDISDVKDKQMKEWVNEELNLPRYVERPKIRTLVTVFTVSNYWKRLIDSKPEDVEEKDWQKEAFDYLSNKAESWDFNALEFYKIAHKQPLQIMGEYVFRKFKLLQAFQIPIERLRTFLYAVERDYGDNYYHTSTHASDVTQVVYYVLTRGGLARYLNDEEIFSVLFAAVIHDYRHPGTNNNFQVKIESNVAMTYNDKSVLENHHVSSAFRLMQDENVNILGNISAEKKKKIRSYVIDLVLATDMAHHSKILYNFQTLLQGNGVDFDNDSDVLLLLKLVMKIGDVSNPARPMNVYVPWAIRISEEQFSQGDKERELALKISPLMDRETTQVGAGQLAFIEYIVLPLFTAFSKSVPEFKEVVENHVESNLAFWRENKNKFKTLDDVRREFDVD